MQQKKETLLVQWNAKIFWILSKMYGNVMNEKRKKTRKKKRNRICVLLLRMNNANKNSIGGRHDY